MADNANGLAHRRLNREESAAPRDAGVARCHSRASQTERWVRACTRVCARKRARQESAGASREVHAGECASEYEIEEKRERITEREREKEREQERGRESRGWGAWATLRRLELLTDCAIL